MLPLTQSLQHFYHGKVSMILLPTGYGKSVINVQQWMVTYQQLVRLPSCYLDITLHSGKTFILKSDADDLSSDESSTGDESDDNLMSVVHDMLKVTAPLHA